MAGYALQPLSVRADAQARIVAQHRGNPLWQDGPYLSSSYPSAVLGGLRDRILQGMAEINAAPVVHRWKKFDLLDPLNQDLVK